MSLVEVYRNCEVSATGILHSDKAFTGIQYSCQGHHECLEVCGIQLIAVL